MDLVGIGVGTFMSALDTSEINTVLPVLRSELHTTVAGVEWVTTVYLLLVSALWYRSDARPLADDHHLDGD